MHPDLLRALAKARHEDHLTRVRTQGTQESNAMAIHCGSLVPVSGWDHSSFGQAHI